MTKTEYLLTCLAEEAAEVAQRCHKAQRFGVLEIEPGTSQSNVARLVGEINDLWGVVELLQEAQVLTDDHILSQELIDAKKARVRKYMSYSIIRGTLIHVTSDNDE